MITELFTALETIASAFGTFLANIFQSVANVIYVPGVADAPGELTIVGIFLLIGLVGSFVIWALRWVLSLIKLR